MRHESIMVHPATSERFLQVTFHYRGSGSAFEELIGILAKSVAHVPGLIWKAWLINKAEAEAGGIYLFADAGALQSYLRGPVLGNIQSQPGVYNLSVKTFDTLNEIALIAFSSRIPPIAGIRSGQSSSAMKGA